MKILLNSKYNNADNVYIFLHIEIDEILNTTGLKFVSLLRYHFNIKVAECCDFYIGYRRTEWFEIYPNNCYLLMNIVKECLNE